MNLPCEGQRAANGTQRYFAAGTAEAAAAKALSVPQRVVAPFEFRLLTGQEFGAAGAPGEPRNGAHGGSAGFAKNHDGDGEHAVLFGSANAEDVKAARQEGLEQGKQEGRRTAHAELEAEMRAAVARERERVTDAVRQFGAVRERYFADVEQEVVKLALAIAARVLHRETAIDPLLLSGAVRVALEKMADRSGVVLRVAAADVAGWERSFLEMEPAERPKVTEDTRLECGECALETRMGVVELGVAVQLEEIEKGFFDLLHRRPVE